MLKTTLGRLLVNDALPEDMRDYSGAMVLDKKGISKLLQEVAERYPERYRDVSHKLAQIGQETAYHTGGFSFGIDDLKITPAAAAIREQLRQKVDNIYASKLPDAEKKKQLVAAMQERTKEFEDTLFAEMSANKNPLAMQVVSGARGNPGNVRSIVGGDLLYEDQNGKPIPLPILHGYAQGLRPVEHWASTFGTRKGVIEEKLSTADAGYLSKQLNQVTHRLLVTGYDAPEGDPHHQRGLPVETNDPDNAGALLGRDTDRYKRNTLLTPKILAELHNAGHDKILIRSPLVGGPPQGGLYARDVGVRERGGLAPRGDEVGMAAAQALSEGITQAAISSKHAGGVAGAGGAVTGFKAINQLIQVPKIFKGGAAHAQDDGKVSAIWSAPGGGHNIMINGIRHYVNVGATPRVKVGDKVEAGDVLSTGIPNPAEIVTHKGIGEGRRYFANMLGQVYRDSGVSYHRRNGELLARGLINHVRLTDEVGDFSPEDVVPYDVLEHLYQPRSGHEIIEPKRAVGKYLEKPVLHHTIGTRVRPSMLPELQHFGVNSLVVHPEPPPFQPEMIRGAEQMQHDPDWMTRQLGSGIKKSLLTAAQRGAASDELGTSFVPGLARAVDFGRVGLTRSWSPADIKKPES